jgi:hypothetical protein
MKAIVTDVAVLSALRPPALLAYLRSRGWTPFERVEGAPLVEWFKDGASGHVEVGVPLHPEWRDYPRRVQEVLTAIADDEGRSQLDVIADLRAMGGPSADDAAGEIVKAQVRDQELAPVAGELLVFVDDGGTAQVHVRLSGGTVWLTQKQMAVLYGKDLRTINEHLRNIYDELELDPAATIRKFRIVQTERNRSGSRQVGRMVDHFSLPAIIAVGYRVRSNQGTRFRQWATARLEELLVKGFVLDDERLKSTTSLGTDYFDELLERIRRIRASERRFYQKLTDVYARCSIDYDANAQITKDFYATVQNKMHWAIHGRTAAEVVLSRANARLPNMGLTTWKGAPDGPIRKADVIVAKTI